MKYQKTIIERRKDLCCAYDAAIKGNTEIEKLPIRPLTEWNYSYYPLVINSKSYLTKIIERMHKENIYPRRYFHPCLDAIPSMVPIPNNAIVKQFVEKMLCLPLSAALTDEDLERICRLLN
jgi:dTDP-4-amino-4,6-dideoxygalactose transaminase